MKRAEAEKAGGGARLKWSPPKYGGSEAWVPYGPRSSLRLSVCWRADGKYDVQCERSRGVLEVGDLTGAKVAAEAWLASKLREALAALEPKP